MKKYTLRFNKANADSVCSFLALQKGMKKVETRAGTEKYRRIAIGDTLVFTCGKEKFEKTVRKVTVFKSIGAMLRAYRVKDIMPDRLTQKELVDAYYSYSGYKDKIRKFGLVAWRFDTMKFKSPHLSSQT